MLADHLNYLNEVQQGDFNRLGSHLPYEWIEQAIANTDSASIRRRRLPAEQVLWLVIALALYRHQSISEVVDELDLALPNPTQSFVSKSAIAQARQRLGEEPLEWLFHTAAQAWSEQTHTQSQFNGLQLFAMDGTVLRTADSLANRQHFGAQLNAGGTVASYPQVRAVTLTAIPTHLVTDVAFGIYGKHEMEYAKELIGNIADHSLTVFDKGFMSAAILHQLSSQGQERHFLIPAKANTRWEVLKGDADDALVRMKVSPQARAKCPTLPKTWQARAVRVVDGRGRSRVLLTSLTDRQRFTADQIAQCYRRRWHIETSYRELKQSMLGRVLTLRSQTVAGVKQEIWGSLIAYNLLRLEMAKAASTAQCTPTDISFVRAMHTMQYELMWMAVTRSQGKLPALLQRLRERLQDLPNKPRPGRSNPRVVKSVRQKYDVRPLNKA